MNKQDQRVGAGPLVHIRTARIRHAEQTYPSQDSRAGDLLRECFFELITSQRDDIETVSVVEVVEAI